MNSQNKTKNASNGKKINISVIGSKNSDDRNSKRSTTTKNKH